MAAPGDVRQLNRLLEGQADGRDPFQDPKMISARQQGREPFDPQADPLRMDEEVISATERQNQPQQSLRDFLAKQDPQEELRMMQTKVPQQLRQAGLGELAEGLSFNKFGRLNLMIRLRERFGERFFENESARKAISIFDQALSKDQQDEKEEMNQMLASSERTLEELLRLQERQGRTR